MNRLRTFLFLLLWAAPAAIVFCDPLAAPSVFIDTDPMGSRIEIDGKLFPNQTPALLRGLAAGNHTAAVWHRGFRLETRDFTVAAGKVPVLTLSLTPNSVVMAYPDNPKINTGEKPLETAGEQFRFPDGTYELGSADGTVKVIPVFPDEGLLTAAGWSLAVISLAAVASTASDAYHINSGWTDHPSLLTVALWGTSAFELPWFLSLSGRKDRWTKESAPKITPQAENLDLAQVTWAQGDEALQEGNLDKALGLFSRVIKEHPESRLVPGAWFRVARIHSVTGRRDLAFGEYRLVADTFPQAEYYDRARKALADLYEATGDKAQALINLNEMVLTDGFFDKADIEAQKTRLTAAPEANNAP